MQTTLINIFMETGSIILVGIWIKSKVKVKRRHSQNPLEKPVKSLEHFYCYEKQNVR